MSGRLSSVARESVLAYKDAWTDRLGLLVVDNTLSDLSSIIDENQRQD